MGHLQIHNGPTGRLSYGEGDIGETDEWIKLAHRSGLSLFYEPTEGRIRTYLRLRSGGTDQQYMATYEQQEVREDDLVAEFERAVTSCIDDAQATIQHASDTGSNQVIFDSLTSSSDDQEVDTVAAALDSLDHDLSKLVNTLSTVAIGVPDHRAAVDLFAHLRDVYPDASIAVARQEDLGEVATPDLLIRPGGAYDQPTLTASTVERWNRRQYRSALEDLSQAVEQAPDPLASRLRSRGFEDVTGYYPIDTDESRLMIAEERSRATRWLPTAVVGGVFLAVLWTGLDTLVTLLTRPYAVVVVGPPLLIPPSFRLSTPSWVVGVVSIGIIVGGLVGLSRLSHRLSGSEHDSKLVSMLTLPRSLSVSAGLGQSDRTDGRQQSTGPSEDVLRATERVQNTAVPSVDIDQDVRECFDNRLRLVDASARRRNVVVARAGVGVVTLAAAVLSFLFGSGISDIILEAVSSLWTAVVILLPLTGLLVVSSCVLVGSYLVYARTGSRSETTAEAAPADRSSEGAATDLVTPQALQTAVEETSLSEIDPADWRSTTAAEHEWDARVASARLLVRAADTGGGNDEISDRTRALYDVAQAQDSDTVTVEDLYRYIDRDEFDEELKYRAGAAVAVLDGVGDHPDSVDPYVPDETDVPTDDDGSNGPVTESVSDRALDEGGVQDTERDDQES